MLRLARRLLSLPVQSRRIRPIRRHKALPFQPRFDSLEDRVVPDGRPLPFPVIFAGSGSGMPPSVRAYDALTGETNFEKTVFEKRFSGGVHVATADFTNDGYPDLVAAAGPNGGPHVRILDGKTGEQIPGPLGNFFAFDAAFRGGINVAAADVDGDGKKDVIVAAGGSGGPHVKVFSGANGLPIASFFAYEETFRGGVNVTAADFTGDGRADIMVGAGKGGGPRVRMFDLAQSDTQPIKDFFAFNPKSRNGISVGSDSVAGDVNGDGTPDLITGSGPGEAARVVVWSGKDGSRIADFAPYAADMTAGLRVATAFISDDAFADIVVSTGEGGPGTIRTFDGQSFSQLTGPVGELTPFGSSYSGGVFVGASNDPPTVTVTAYEPNAAELKNPMPDATSGVFQFKRDGDLTSPLTVYYINEGTATSDGTYPTPTDPVDYTGFAAAKNEFLDGKWIRKVEIPAGQTTKYVKIQVVDDLLVEESETATVTLIASSTYTLGDSKSDTVWIADNDPFVDPTQTVWIGRVDHSVQENYELTTQWNTGSIELVRSIADSALSVGFTVTGSATLDSDYAMYGPTKSGYGGQIVETKLSKSGSVTFAANQDRLTVRLDPIWNGGDAKFESIVFSISWAGETKTTTAYVCGDRSPTNGIAPPPTGPVPGPVLDVFVTTGIYGSSTGDPNAAESEDNSDAGSFLVTYLYQTLDPNFVAPYADQNSDVPVTFGGTAEAGIDFTYDVSRESISKETIVQQSRNVYRFYVTDRVTITPIDDDDYEGSETVDIAIGRDATDTGGCIGDKAIVTIADNDSSLPIVSVSSPDYWSSEEETSTGAYVLSRNETKLAFPLTVSFYMDGTAHFTTDYSLKDNVGTIASGGSKSTPVQVAFPAGVNRLEYKLTPEYDLTPDEGNENADMNLSTSLNYVISNSSAAVWIIDEKKKDARIIPYYLSYLGDKNFEVYKDKPEDLKPPKYSPDLPGTEHGADWWDRTNMLQNVEGNGNADDKANETTNTFPDVKAPVGYVRDGRVKLQMYVRTNKPADFQNVANLKLRGIGPDGMIFEGAAQLTTMENFGVGGPINVIKFAQEAEAVDTKGQPIKLVNKVKDYKEFGVTWEVYDGTKWLYAGKTVNHLYVVLGQPLATATPYETVLDIAVRNADGKETALDSVNAIWENFKNPTPGVKRKVIDGFNEPDGKEMRYWINMEQLNGLTAPQKLTVQETIKNRSILLSLLRTEAPSTIDNVPGTWDLNGVGTCEAWSRLFKASLGVMGITGADGYMVEPSQVIVGAGQQANFGLLVKNWQFNAADAMPDGIFTHTVDVSALDQVGSPGQGTTNPPSIFVKHFLIKFTSPTDHKKRIYDPSYGTDYPTEQEWTNGSIDGFVKSAGFRAAKVNQNPPVPEVRFTLDNQI